MTDDRKITTEEVLARAVCAAWGIDPDKRDWGGPGDSDTFLTKGVNRVEVQRFVAGFLACADLLR